MDVPQTNHVVNAAKELGGSIKEVAGLVTDMKGALDQVNGLYDHGYEGAGKSMIKFGIALVMIPEPFMVTDAIGCGIIAAGWLYNRFVPPPLYIDNIFDSIQEQVKALHLGGEGLIPNFSVPVDFSQMHFEL